QMNPLLESPTGDDWSQGADLPEHHYDIPIAAGSHGNGASFELRELTGGLDLSRYQTGALGDNMGFVMAPGDALRSHHTKAAEAGSRAHPGGARDGQAGPEPGSSSGLSRGQGPVDQTAFTGTGSVHSDTVSRILLDELEGVDFYIAQGYVDIARDTLDRLRDEHGDHAEILVRYRRLGIPTRAVQAASPALLAQDAAALPAEEFPGLHVESTNEDESIFMGEVPRVSPAAGIGATTGELMPIMEQPGVSSFSTRADSD